MSLLMTHYTSRKKEWMNRLPEAWLTMSPLTSSLVFSPSRAACCLRIEIGVTKSESAMLVGQRSSDMDFFAAAVGRQLSAFSES